MQSVLVNDLRSLFCRSVVSLLFILHAATAVAAPVIHHEIDITLTPDERHLAVTDKMTLPEQHAGKEGLELYLHAGLSPKVMQPGVSFELADYPSDQTPVPLQRLSLTLPQGQKQVTLSYSGEIHHPVEQLGAEYARSFSVSPGLISAEGVFLSGSSYWYARPETALHTFTVNVSLPAGWTSVSQGHRQQASGAVTTWSIQQPQDEIYLIAARFSEYIRATGAVDAMVFLRQPDEKLAKKYLDVTAQYVEMYRKLIGTYPYKKFALVENFWETGYGMPSFTLLGPRVIRFPFILHSSYPHEILHNWWGNGVYVDYATGNWAEGLTSYLADHLIKEQRGQAINYRRNALQKYTDFVTANRDFPLTQFRARHSATTEAVGYGKTMMFFHMLRLQTGDEKFIQALQRFYRQYRFKYAGFDDLRKVFEDVTGMPLAAMFKQWISRTGAPRLRVSNAVARKMDNGYLLTADITQIQEEQAYNLRVPVSVVVQGRDQAVQSAIMMDSKQTSLKLALPSRPIRLDVDPEFDLFRRLHRNEIPAALTRAFGAEKVLIVLPSAESQQRQAAYASLAQSWQQGQQGQVEITDDTKLEKLPLDRAVWLFGWSNRFSKQVTDALVPYGAVVDKETISIDKTTLARNRHAVVMTARNPANPDHPITWLANDNPASMAGLGRKLPHYGRYSYLGFEGDEPANIAKGQWPVVNSPMSVTVKPADTMDAVTVSVVRAKRQALAQLPPVFSQERMLRDIQFLASEAMQGRGLGTTQLDQAAEYIAQEFKNAGLQAGGDGDSYFQAWHEDVGEPLGRIRLRNVVAVLPGKNPDWRQQSLLVTAHYDHLGLGWPDVHKGDEGKVHFGADDNASGVAVMLELARVLAGKGGQDRTIVFAAFTGEETGRQQGALHYINSSQRFPVSEVMAMLNLDTVGRLGQNKLTVLGTGSAREWVHVFRGVGFVTGIEIQSVADEYGASDQKRFLAAGVPSVQFFSGAHADFHRPTDTPDKIDVAGLVKVATVLKETIDYLATREEPLTSQLSNAAGHDQAARGDKGGRRVSLGTVPDFAFNGKGVRITGTVAGSPAEKAGLKQGDIIVRLNGKEIDGLRDFAGILRALKDQDKLDIVFTRDGSQQTVSTRVVSR